MNRAAAISAASNSGRTGDVNEIRRAATTIRKPPETNTVSAINTSARQPKSAACTQSGREALVVAG
jgi:hypothetical protein